MYYSALNIDHCFIGPVFVPSPETRQQKDINMSYLLQNRGAGNGYQTTLRSQLAWQHEPQP